MSVVHRVSMSGAPETHNNAPIQARSYWHASGTPCSMLVAFADTGDAVNVLMPSLTFAKSKFTNHGGNNKGTP